MSEQKDEKTERAKRITEAVNRHGHAFTRSVIEEAEAIFNMRQSQWVFEVAEFPVQKDKGTRVDFILSRDNHAQLLVCECKRANPGTSEWVFFHVSEMARSYENRFIAERVENTDDFKACGVPLSAPQNAWYGNIAIEPKENRKESDAIEDAATQVCRGVQGLVDWLANQKNQMKEQKVITLIPVIFTTARLFVSTVDLNKAELLTGTVNVEPNQVHEHDLVYYQYPISPALKHSQTVRTNHPTLPHHFANEAIRTIPIVTAKGIPSFFKFFYPQAYPNY